MNLPDISKYFGRIRDHQHRIQSVGKGPKPFAKPRGAGSTANGKQVQVYVKHLPDTLTKEKFFQIFAHLDDLVGHRLIMRDDKCDGFGFVVFNTKQAAAKAIEALHGKVRLTNGKLLHASMVQENRIFVKNLHEKVSWKQLFRLFTTHGQVKYVSVIVNERGFNRGYSTGRAIVCFATPEAACTAIGKMNGQLFYGKPMCVEYFKSSYELRKEMFDTYFGRKEHGKVAGGKAKGVPLEPIDPSDMAYIKKMYTGRLTAFVQQSHPLNYTKITELMLEYDNDQLKSFFEVPHFLQTKVDNAATLLTVGTLRD